MTHPTLPTIRRFLVLLVATPLLGVGCATTPAMKALVDESRSPSPPVRQARPIASAVAEFHKMIRAYYPLDRDIVLQVDLIANDGLEKALPTDLGQYLVQVLNDIGRPLRGTQVSVPVLPGVFAAPVSAPHPNAAPDFILGGSLLYRATVASAGAQHRIDIAGNGRPKVDAGDERDVLQDVTEMKVGLSLKLPNGLAVASAIYRITVERRERSTSISFFVAGSGAGLDRKVTVSENSGDALYDAMAAIVIELLGRALRMPYYRTSPLFAEGDSNLDAQERDELSRMTEQGLGQYVKTLMWVAGAPMNLQTQALSDSDRKQVVALMQRESLDPSDRSSLVELAFRLWSGLDFRVGAERVEQRLAETAHQLAEYAEAKRLRAERLCVAARREKRSCAGDNIPRKAPPKPAPKPQDVSCTANLSRDATNVTCSVRTTAPKDSGARGAKDARGTTPPA